MKSTSWKSGDWWAICDQCGRKGYASQMTKRWDGRMVHTNPDMGCFETRHPQDFVRSRPDSQRVPWTRPNSDLNADGTPKLSSAPAFNCSGATEIPIPSVIVQRTVIGKGRSRGPVLVEDGAEVIVLCEWIIE